jgi:hypothetical protein
MEFDVSLGCTFEVVEEVRRRGESREWIERGIRCLVCGMTSWSSGDLQNRWCHKCQKFHRRQFEYETVLNGPPPTPPPVDDPALTELEWIDDLMLD